MIGGFLGTLIGLERAVALGWRWAYCAPLFAAVGGLTLLLDLHPDAGHFLMVLGSLFLISISLVLCHLQPTGFMATMGLGAVLWFVGNLLWTVDFPLYQVVPWWIGFLVLTIAGERLEMTRLMHLSIWNRVGFALSISFFLLGLALSLIAFQLGLQLSGIGLLALALWLLYYDIAWRTVRHVGLPRYTAVCLLTGYVWLGVGGVLWLLFAHSFIAGPHYDAMLHVVFLGFVFSMIFGHAPIILPSITGVALPFREAFYIHFGLLHLSLLLRVAGDLGAWMPAQRWGGLLGVLAILLFLANNVRAVRLGQSSGVKSA
ncbi:MAG: hypothetical protein ACE5MM_03320 [Nitrospiraceae bacterium]